MRLDQSSHARPSCQNDPPQNHLKAGNQEDEIPRRCKHWNEVAVRTRHAKGFHRKTT